MQNTGGGSSHRCVLKCGLKPFPELDFLCVSLDVVWTSKVIKKNTIGNTGLCHLKYHLRPWVCDVRREDLEGRELTCGMVLVGRLSGRHSPWTTCWPGGPGAAAPPPPASGGAALLQPDLHQQPPHTAYRKDGRGLYLEGQWNRQNSGSKQAKLLWLERWTIYTQDTESWFLSARGKMC